MEITWLQSTQRHGFRVHRGMASEYTEGFILITLYFFLSFNFEWSFDHVTFRTLNWGTTKKISFFL